MKKFVSLFGENTASFRDLNERAAAYAEEKGFSYSWAPQEPFDKQKVIALLKEADAGLIDVQPYDDSIFSEIKERCRLLIRFGVGFDAVNLKDASKNGICVTRTSGANALTVAEMALSLILAAMRQHERNRRAVESGIWVKNCGQELSCKKVGIMGFGAIGKKLAAILKGFECEILVYDPWLSDDAAKEMGVRKTELDDLFRECDAISVHVPYTKETHHLVNKERLLLMKPSAVIVCNSRGNIVDEDALAEVLKENRILGAGLDVYATEPLPLTSPLIGLDNVILTPHVSGQTYDALWNTYKKAIDIATDFFDGKELSKADLLNPDYREGC